MIPVVSDDLFDALTLRPHCLDLLSGLNQGLDARRRVAVVGILHRDPDDRAGLEVDRMLAWCAKCVRPSFIFVIFASGSSGWAPRRSSPSCPGREPD
jgi:hypothetical protein